ncbi:MAG TPA: hypothetical protein VHK69_15450, partial [Chitinophagaceae bacterium]|nr:hypothetical protein [Chitinophagaceae bacterium]
MISSFRRGRMVTYLLLLTLFVLQAPPLFSQMPFNAAAPNGSSKKAVVSEQVGLTLVTITYHRPAVNGREGRIWEGVVHKGFKDL